MGDQQFLWEPASYEQFGEAAKHRVLRFDAFLGWEEEL